MPTWSTPALLLAGRLLLALMFVLSGPGKIANAEATAGYMASAGLPGWPLLAMAVGAFEVLTGVALAIGLQTRRAALALAVFTVAASLGFHAFWAVPADQQFMQQLLFLKNLAVAGGLLFVAGSGAGAWSVEARFAPVHRARGSSHPHAPARARAHADEDADPQAHKA